MKQGDAAISADGAHIEPQLSALRPKNVSAHALKHADQAEHRARPEDWSAYLAPRPVASGEFMENVESLPTQERES